MNLSVGERMFDHMDWEGLTTDQLEERLIVNHADISAITAEEMEILEILDRRQVATADGCKSLSEWTAARLDVGLDTARTLVRTMRRTETRPDLREALVSGEASLDRVEALSNIVTDVGLLSHRDVAGVRAEAAKQARMTVAKEHRSAADQFLVMQPTLDESWWRLWDGLDGPSGALVDKVLTENAEDLPVLPDGTRGETSWRKAVALTELCVSGDGPSAHVTVFVDAKPAVETSGESGVVLNVGPKVGRQALQAVLCDATTEVIARSEDGRPMEYGRQQRTAPPGLKRAILHRDANMCVADGCDSRYRLEIHHKTPWSEGGETNPDDLVTLCWFHHHVVVHQRGYRLYNHPVTGRVRFRKRER